MVRGKIINSVTSGTAITITDTACPSGYAPFVINVTVINGTALQQYTNNKVGPEIQTEVIYSGESFTISWNTSNITVPNVGAYVEYIFQPTQIQS
ncbi:MAG: hypothetical protein EOM87_08480 [Clostridia bacterium]|nr:hypothetical protein [Clostridia bacterium]